jgi:hypothetical protein
MISEVDVLQFFDTAVLAADLDLQDELIEDSHELLHYRQLLPANLDHLLLKLSGFLSLRAVFLIGVLSVSNGCRLHFCCKVIDFLEDDKYFNDGQYTAFKILFLLLLLNNLKDIVFLEVEISGDPRLSVTTLVGGNETEVSVFFLDEGPEFVADDEP